MVCHSVDCQLYCQFGLADSTVLYTDCVLWLSVCITLCNIELAVIQLTATVLTLAIIKPIKLKELQSRISVRVTRNKYKIPEPYISYLYAQYVETSTEP